MKLKTTKRRSFTLIEILIATTIFAFAIVTCFGILMLVLGNQSSINMNSEVNRETQRLARQISDDVTAANAITDSNGNLTTSVNGVKAKGIAFAKYDGTRYEFVSGSTTEAFGYFNYPEEDGYMTTGTGINSLILFTKDTSGSEIVKVYRYWGNELKYLSVPITNDGSINVDAVFLADRNQDFIKLNSDNVYIVRFYLGGFACMSESCSQSPYVQLDMRVESAKEIIWTGTNAYAEIRTMVAGRSL